MMVQVEDVEKFLGSEVRDPYGRVVGVFVSFYSEVDGNVTGIELVRGDGAPIYVAGDRLEVTPDTLIVIPEWRIEAVRVEKQLDRARKRARAIEDLYSSKEINVQTYEEMKKNIEVTINKLKEKAKNVKNFLRKRLNTIEDEILHIDKAINYLKLGYTSGEVVESRFKTAIDSLRSSKNRYVEEKKDIEKHIELLEKLENDVGLAQKIETVVEQAQQAQSQENVAEAQKPIDVRVIT